MRRVVSFSTSATSSADQSSLSQAKMRARRSILPKALSFRFAAIAIALFMPIFLSRREPLGVRKSRIARIWILGKKMLRN
jgi:hypothetical protein